MRTVEIEAWALRVLDKVRAGGLHEDARVELKAAWLGDPNRTARQLGGHSNVLRGDDALWLIGVDEKRGAVGVEPADFAAWWPQIRAEFHGEVPTPTEVIIHDSGQTIVALHLSTDRAPYLVRVEGGGRVEREVPWREGTSVRTATRADLLRILVPRQVTPEVELISGTADLYEYPDRRNLRCDVKVYLRAPIGAALVFPEHRASVEVSVPDLGWSFPADVNLRAGAYPRAIGQSPIFREAPDEGSMFIAASDEQMVVQGPGFMRMFANIDVHDRCEIASDAHLRLRAVLHADEPDVAVSIDMAMRGRLVTAEPELRTREYYKWRYQP